MGCEIVVAGARPAERRAIEELLADRERMFTRFRPDSELSVVNAASGAVLVSREFATALRVALDAAAATEGLVDPTLGAALVAAGYDRDFAELDHHSAGSPTPREADAARGAWREVELTGRHLSRPVSVEVDGDPRPPCT